MTADTIISEIIKWLRTAVLIMLLIALAVALLKAYGVTIPIKGLGPVEMAYLAGAYWLTR